jgi:hypothetical protein
LILSISGNNAKVVLGADQDLAFLSTTTSEPLTQGFDLNSPAGAGQFRSVRIYSTYLDSSTMKNFLWAQIQNAKSNPGDGIYDSGLAGHPNSALGIAFFQDPHGEATILIRPTRIGDLNLDGAVTISDFIDLASHFNGPGGWQEGDLNGDGSVTISDFIDLASNFNGTYAGEVFPISPQDQQALNAFAASVGASVPEPTTLLLLPLASLLSACRGRRRPLPQAWGRLK